MPHESKETSFPYPHVGVTVPCGRYEHAIHTGEWLSNPREPICENGMIEDYLRVTGSGRCHGGLYDINPLKMDLFEPDNSSMLQ